MDQIEVNTLIERSPLPMFSKLRKKGSKASSTASVAEECHTEHTETAQDSIHDVANQIQELDVSIAAKYDQPGYDKKAWIKEINAPDRDFYFPCPEYDADQQSIARRDKDRKPHDKLILLSRLLWDLSGVRHIKDELKVYEEYLAVKNKRF